MEGTKKRNTNTKYFIDIVKGNRKSGSVNGVGEKPFFIHSLEIYVPFKYVTAYLCK